MIILYSLPFCVITMVAALTLSSTYSRASTVWFLLMMVARMRDLKEAVGKAGSGTSVHKSTNK
jgi:hypothetical protein